MKSIKQRLSRDQCAVREISRFSKELNAILYKAFSKNIQEDKSEESEISCFLNELKDSVARSTTACDTLDMDKN